MMFLGALGILAFPVLLIIGLIAVFRKTGTAKKWFKISGGVLVAAIIILVVSDTSTEDVEVASTEVNAEEVDKDDVSAEEKTKDIEAKEAKEENEKKEKEIAKEKAKNEKEEKKKEKENKESKEKMKKEHSKYADSFKSDIKIMTDEKLTLSDESYDFIIQNYSLFPALNKADIEIAKNMADSTITFKHLNKNAQPYFQKIATFAGTVISVEEFPAEVSETMSLTHLMDNDGQSYQVLMYKGTGEVFEDDIVRFWGVPVGLSSFENVSGGTTNVQVFLGSHIEKTQ